LGTLWKGTQFMTEKPGGSDVGTIETVARQDGDTWRLYGEKWICSHTDAEVALLLARPEGAPPGTRGLALFAMPRTLDDGRRNGYRIVRLKDKLGTRSMASGEILLEGAIGYPVGRLDRGFKQMMEQVNLSRLSHGVRAAAMMRRCFNEALVVAQTRSAFGRRLIEQPLMRRQLMKLLVPTEQALSMSLATAKTMEAAHDGDKEAASVLRILTGLLKLRACRDNVPVATGAMEVRGGVGYIEEFANARLIRDAQVGLLWEGTSNINALDVIQRAIGKDRADQALGAMLHAKIEGSNALPSAFAKRLAKAVDRAIALARKVAAGEAGEALARTSSTALYNAASAVLMAWEGTRPGVDARRVLLSRFVVEHRLAPRDPLEPGDTLWEDAAIDRVLAEGPVSLEQALPLLTGPGPG
jgi:alkylation response protein AidB-like acyl-CoA dehydrogenase